MRGFLDAQRPRYGDRLIARVQSFAQSVKLRVKAQFPMQYFYRATEVIEEARSFGAGIVIPHPEQFWTILLADYDVDGYEVWNPQSQRYTEFLIDTLARKNRKGWNDRRQLVFMGDDTHMSEKLRNLTRPRTKCCARSACSPPGTTSASESACASAWTGPASSTNTPPAFRLGRHTPRRHDHVKRRQF